MRTKKKVTVQELELKDFAKTNAFSTRMISGGVDSYDNYVGRDLDTLVVVAGKNRDSDLLSQSNFDAALERLGGEGKYVSVHRFGHWACGWLELICVDPRSKSKLKIAYEIYQDLDSYPVLDEDDFFERESDIYHEVAEESAEDIAEALSKHFGVKNSSTLKELAYQLQREEQYRSGECLTISKYHTPDKYSLRELESALDDIYLTDTKLIELRKELSSAVSAQRKESV